MRITRRAQETQADEIGALLANLFDDRFVGCFGIGLVEHEAFVTGAFDDGGKGHNADRRKTHDTDIAIGGALGGGQRIKLRIADVDQEDAHTKQIIMLGIFHNPALWKFQRAELQRFNMSGSLSKCPGVGWRNAVA